MKNSLFFTLFLLISASLTAQKYMTRNGYVGFFSATPMEDIKADNNQVASVLEASSGELVFQVLMKSFHFEKALMEEHFNENYVESELYPKASFKGKIENINEVDFKKDGDYKVVVSGELNMHGVTKAIKIEGNLSVKAENIEANSQFLISPEDYQIDIPGIVKEKIAKNIEVTVKMKYEKL